MSVLVKLLFGKYVRAPDKTFPVVEIAIPPSFRIPFVGKLEITKVNTVSEGSGSVAVSTIVAVSVSSSVVKDWFWAKGGSFASETLIVTVAWLLTAGVDSSSLAVNLKVSVPIKSELGIYVNAPVKSPKAVITVPPSFNYPLLGKEAIE